MSGSSGSQKEGGQAVREEEGGEGENDVTI